MNYIALLGRALPPDLYQIQLWSFFLGDHRHGRFQGRTPGLRGRTAVWLSILLDFKAKWGAWPIVLFLVLVMHNYWTIPDPMMHQMQQIMFLNNLSMLGAAFLIAYSGAGL